MPPGSAKALVLNTPIPTPNGWSAIGELKVGDTVFDENGQPCRVIRVSPVWKDRPVFKVITDCGDEIVADEDHEWLVRLCGKRPVFKLKTTRQLCRDRAKRPMITHAKALELPETDLPIDPYLLGVWIGDGHSAGMRITSSVEDQPWLRSELERLGFHTTSASNQPTLFGVTGVRAKFVSLGLIDDPVHATHGRKYIPAAYMRASKEQRLSLLQGLVDTDGTVCKERGCTTFCTTRPDLAHQFRELVRSLGVKAGWSESRAMLNGKDCGPCFKISFYLAASARMPRKAASCRDQWRTPDTYIEVVPDGIEDTVCIEVDSPSHLFLAGRSMTPTHNSTYTSLIFPAWYIGRHPSHLIMSASHTVQLAESWGRKVRNMIGQDTYQHVFRSVQLSSESSAAGRWETTAGGGYRAAGVGTGIAGFRADIAVVDDPYRSQEDADSDVVRKKIWEWWGSDMLPRLKPDAPVVLIQTRWHLGDVAGSLIADMEDGGEEWETLILPAFAEEDDPMGREPGEVLWPEWQSEEALLRIKNGPAMSTRQWASLYQQKPIPDGGGILRANWWQLWDDDERPVCSYIVAGVDTATSTKTSADFTACAVFGVFQEGPLSRIMLLYAWQARLELPELVDRLVETGRSYEVDKFIIEGKTAGIPVINELRRRAPQYSIQNVDPSRDKITRAYAVQGIFESGCVYAPDRRWADGVVQACAEFPAGLHDDMVDAVVYAIAHIRSIGTELYRDDIGDVDEAQWRQEEFRPLYP